MRHSSHINTQTVCRLILQPLSAVFVVFGLIFFLPPDHRGVEAWIKQLFELLLWLAEEIQIRNALEIHSRKYFYVVGLVIGWANSRKKRVSSRPRWVSMAALKHRPFMQSAYLSDKHRYKWAPVNLTNCLRHGRVGCCGVLANIFTRNSQPASQSDRKSERQSALKVILESSRPDLISQHNTQRTLSSIRSRRR